MSEKPPILNYAGPAVAETATFHRERFIYGVGVGIACVAQFFAWAGWPHTSNSADPLRAELFVYMYVIGGAAIAWMLIGLRRIVLSPLARRDVIMWILFVANVLATFPIMDSGYQ